MNSFSDTTIQQAQANTLAAIKVQVADLNKVLKADYLTKFSNWAQNVSAGRPNGDPPKPPNAFVVGYFDDPTTGPGTAGFYQTVIQWAYPAVGKEPVCDMPPLPVVVPPPAPLPEREDIRNVPLGDTTPVGFTVTAPDGSKWQKQSSPTPFGVAVFYVRVG